MRLERNRGMKAKFKPIAKEHLRDLVSVRIEEMILSGKISIGEKLPPERELAGMLGVSRPVVHDGLMDLVNKGLVTMKPRFGTYVNDYRRQGSLALLASLLSYHRGSLEPKLLSSLIAMRMLFELETARLAARNRTGEYLSALEEIIRTEGETDARDTSAVSELDFTFHHHVALASGNLVYPLIINSFKHVYTNISFQAFSDPAVVPVAFGYHARLLEAIRARDETGAVVGMETILEHGRKNLEKALRSGRSSTD